MKEIFHRTSIRKYLDKPVEDEKHLHLSLLSHVTAFLAECLNMHRLT